MLLRRPPLPGDGDSSVRQLQMGCAPIPFHKVPGQKSPMLQIHYRKRNMGLGNAPAGDNIHRPIVLRMVIQKQQHIQCVAGQIPLPANRFQGMGIPFTRLVHRIKIAGQFHHRVLHNCSFLNFRKYTIVVSECQHKNTKQDKSPPYRKARLGKTRILSALATNGAHLCTTGGVCLGGKPTPWNLTAVDGSIMRAADR